MLYRKGEYKMSKITKIWLIIAAFLAILGLLICLVALAASQGDLRLLETEKYVTTVHEPGEFSNISIHTDTADILLQARLKVRARCRPYPKYRR